MEKSVYMFYCDRGLGCSNHKKETLGSIVAQRSGGHSFLVCTSKDTVQQVFNTLLPCGAIHSGNRTFLIFWYPWLLSFLKFLKEYIHIKTHNNPTNKLKHAFY